MGQIGREFRFQQDVDGTLSTFEHFAHHRFGRVIPVCVCVHGRFGVSADA